jgi:hypothetical protein
MKFKSIILLLTGFFSSAVILAQDPSIKEVQPKEVIVESSVAEEVKPAEERKLTPEQEKRLQKIKEVQEERKRQAAIAAEIRRLETIEVFKKQKISTNLLEKYDLNKNGAIDPHEWQRQRKDMLKLRELSVTNQPLPGAK